MDRVSMEELAFMEGGKEGERKEGGTRRKEIFRSPDLTNTDYFVQNCIYFVILFKLSAISR